MLSVEPWTFKRSLSLQSGMLSQEMVLDLTYEQCRQKGIVSPTSTGQFYYFVVIFLSGPVSPTETDDKAVLTCFRLMWGCIMDKVASFKGLQ